MNTRRSKRGIINKVPGNDKTEVNESDSTKKTKQSTKKVVDEDDGSSSDSSVGDYLKKPDEIDLNSSFFDTNNTSELKEFEKIEQDIFSKVKHLSDSSDSECEEPLVKKDDAVIQNTQEDACKKINFSQLQEYNKKIEEAKTCVKNYKSKASKEENDLNISELLTLGEMKADEDVANNDNIDSDDEMEWEEIEEKEEAPIESVQIPKEGVQITVSLPNVVRKKKGIDFVAAVKRRINRIKKENQVYIHKVHLLCWIAHGNFVNSLLNNESLLGMSLSLLPSEQCYPPKHVDMKYLEQIVRWYGKMMKLNENMEEDNQTPLEQALQAQISKKEAQSKKHFVYIFIMILRSLGLQCRLVLSLQCLPLRPPNEELCSLSTKKEEKQKSKKESDKEVPPKQVKEYSTPSTSKSETPNHKNTSQGKITPAASKTKSVRDRKAVSSKKSNTEKKAIKKNENKKQGSSTKTSNKNIKIPQVDGADDEIISKINSKPNLRKLKEKIATTRNAEKQSAKKLPEKNDKKAAKPNLNNLKDEAANSTRHSKKQDKTESKSKKAAAEKSKTKIVHESSKPNLKNLSDKVQSSTHNSKKLNKIDTKSDKPDLRNLSSKRTSSEIQTTSNADTSDPDFKTDANKNKSKKVKVAATNGRESSSVAVKKFAKKLDVRQDIINIIKDQMVDQKHITAKKLVKKHKYESDDSDYIPEVEPERKRRKSSGSEKDFKVNMNVKKRVKPRSEIDRRVLSTDDEEDSQDTKKTKKGNDIWVEVFLESEEKWISADIVKGQIHCVSELYSRASHPVSYILAWNNNLSIKDVTARYCTRWNTVTRKLRVDSAWWKETLKPFMGRKTSRDREEDEDLARQQLDQPLPTTISEYKDHPLYVLKRHLLKFQAIYPPDALTLGFVRNEPVYSRECVYTLHSREIWVKHAKVVKPGQTPYKIVKARPKYDKLSGTVISDQPLELFGIWQVEDYVPPVAENGIVPRNAFGNVELFKACMLPKGTVHLQLPGLNKIARKLKIDCAPAVVGFDFHGGWSHPTFDGFVVCEEFADTLVAAWEEDQAESARKEQEKFEKRVYDNWRKLIKGLLIRERLKARYDFGDSSKSKKSKGLKVTQKKRRIQSDDEDDESQ